MEDIETQTLAIVQAFIHLSASDIGLKENLYGYVECPIIPENLLKGPEIVEIITKLVDEFDNRYKSAGFEDQIKSFGLDEKGNLNIINLKNSYIDVLNNLFESINWGRIIAMFAFLRMIVIRLLHRSEYMTINELIISTSKFINIRLRDFIASNGGWPGLLNFTCINNNCIDVKRRVLQGLGGIAGVAGVAVVVGFIASKL